jgi:hypothetical protein
LLTGFNTDVEFDGAVYHVQTEDKGLQTPIILSLVYSGGAILASKRSPYDDLIARGFDEAILAQRLSRQHKLICAAVHAGRLEELKRMGEREPAVKAPPKTPVADKPIEEAAAEASKTESAVDRGKDQSAAGPQSPFPNPESDEDNELLRVTLLDDEDLRSGESVTFRVLVSRATGKGRQPAQKARVVVKTLGTSFRPASKVAATNAEGIAFIPVLLPTFESGRAAVLIQVNADGERAELRRIILPAQSK